MFLSSFYLVEFAESSSDLVKASECVNELEYAFEVMDWKGITILEDYHGTMMKERQKIEEQARQLIKSSFDLGDQSYLGVVLQVFLKFLEKSLSSPIECVNCQLTYLL